MDYFVGTIEENKLTDRQIAALQAAGVAIAPEDIGVIRADAMLLAEIVSTLIANHPGEPLFNIPSTDIETVCKNWYALDDWRKWAKCVADIIHAMNKSQAKKYVN